MRINSISFSNFKYIDCNKTEKLDFKGANLVVMGGPNGYGKTTVFDAIELLITGQIKHFNSELPNRGKHNLSILANNCSENITISAEFQNEDIVTIIKRVFEHQKTFSSKIYMNDIIIEEDSLYKFLGINKNLFEIGIYISQLDSLNFLQQKYRDRKESITKILDSSGVEGKKDKFIQLKKNLVEKNTKYTTEKSAELDKIKNKRSEYETSLKNLQMSQKDIPYMALFPNKAYLFDLELFDNKLEYESIISPLDDLIKFSKYKIPFLIKKRNDEITTIKQINKKIYLALFYKNKINWCNNNKNLISQIKKLEKIKQDYENKIYTFNENLFIFLGLDEDIINKIQKFLSSKNEIESGMTKTQSKLNDVIKQRNTLLNKYNIAISEKIIEAGICPLCGRASTEIDNLFILAEEALKSNLGLIVDKLKPIVEQINSIYNNNIAIKIDKLVIENKLLLETYSFLTPYLEIETKTLEIPLKKEDLVFLHTEDNVNLDIFEIQYTQIQNNLNSKLSLEDTIITEEMNSQFQRIHLEFYSQLDIYDEEILNAKKFYIASMFSNKISINLNNSIAQINRTEKIMCKYNELYTEKINILDKIIEKYTAAYKQYQSKIIENIKIPLFIFSGKIIQNYPLGLGIIMEIKTNGIEFKSGEMERDIFNNLSTGQLNGVMISVLLSVKDIFASENSFNTLLIDDPLQSIDDISTISFIDLIYEHFQDTQIILSTHEDDKVNLLRYKYKNSTIFNMQQRYLL